MGECSVYRFTWNARSGNREANGVIPAQGKVFGVYKVVDDKHMIKALGNNTFGEQRYTIPRHHKREQLDDEMMRMYCMDAVPKPELKGLEVPNEWEDATRKDHLTIGDIRKLKKGDTVPLLIMDRNYLDIAFAKNKGNTLYTPVRFFRSNKATYIHDADLHGTIVWSWSKEKQPFEFELNYDNERWYPLIDGHIPRRDKNRFRDAPYKTAKSWTSFPATTRVGWRGPSMPWNDLDKYQKVWFYQEHPV